MTESDRCMAMARHFRERQKERSVSGDAIGAHGARTLAEWYEAMAADAEIEAEAQQAREVPSVGVMVGAVGTTAHVKSTGTRRVKARAAKEATDA